MNNEEMRKLVVSVQMVTPESAQQMIDRSKQNRSILESNVRKLAQAIKDGDWEVTAGLIALDGDGGLVNGQHRCRAIVEAGIPVYAVVATGVPQKAYDRFDVAGRPRRVSDQIQFREMDRRTLYEGAARLIAASDSGAFDPKALSEVPRKLLTEVLAMFSDDFQHITKSIASGGCKPRSTFVAGLVPLVRWEPDRSATLIQNAAAGVGLERNTGLWHLHNTLISQSKPSSLREDEFLRVVRCSEMIIYGETIRAPRRTPSSEAARTMQMLIENCRAVEARARGAQPPTGLVLVEPTGT